MPSAPNAQNNRNQPFSTRERDRLVIILEREGALSEENLTSIARFFETAVNNQSVFTLSGRNGTFPISRNMLQEEPSGFVVSPDALNERWFYQSSSPRLSQNSQNSRNDFSSFTFGPIPETDDHFTTRQARRATSDQRAAARAWEQADQDATEQINQLNRDRSSGNKFDSMCNDCHQGIQSRVEGWQEIDNHYICAECSQRNYCRCTDCNNLKANSRVYASDHGMVCLDCLERQRYRQCEECSNFYRPTDDDGDYCANCRHHEQSEDELSPSERTRIASYTEPAWRHYSKKKVGKFFSDSKGSILESDRIFSVEFETIYPSIKALNKILSQQPKALGACLDASIEGNGAEFQTPKMKGKAGEDFIFTFTDNLKKAKFQAEHKTCGLHIHLDGKNEFTKGDTALNRLKVLFLFYLIFEDVIFSFLPKSRRRNRYCKSIKEGYHVSEIMNAPSIEELEKVWYRVGTTARVMNSKREHRNNTRYAGVNFHTLISEDHLEIRYHSGTINPVKIMEWVNLHTKIMDLIVSNVITFDTIDRSQDFLFLEEKTEAFLEFLSLSKGSRDYFLKRQKKFTEKVAEPLEEDAFVLA